MAGLAACAMNPEDLHKNGFDDDALWQAQKAAFWLTYRETTWFNFIEGYTHDLQRPNDRKDGGRLCSVSDWHADQ
jgi:hypothetical protein